MLSQVGRASAGFVLSISLLASAAPDAATGDTKASAAEPMAQPLTIKKTKRKKRAASAAGVAQRAKHLASHDIEPAAPYGFAFKGSASFGFQHGYGVRRFDSPLTSLRALWSPWIRLGPIRVELPLDYSQFQLPSADLSEFRGTATLRATLLLSRHIEPFASAELAGAWRPRWPDPYQPDADGRLRATSRFSYLQRTYQLGAQALLGRFVKARIAYNYSLWDYRSDPAFRPVDSPDHLTPSDHDEHLLQGSVGATLGALRPRLALDLFQRNYFFVFARDRRTGKSHAGRGGPPPNPLYVVHGIEPELSLAARLGELAVRGSFGVRILDDVFQGYYSSVAPHPALSARWLGSERWSLGLGAELWLRRYGPDSYAEGPSHPALTFGGRRVDRSASAELDFRWRLTNGWALAALAKGTRRRTNFPAYRPGAFPRTARYDIDWNYDNWQLLLSIESRGRQD